MSPLSSISLGKGDVGLSVDSELGEVRKLSAHNCLQENEKVQIKQFHCTHLNN